MPDFLREHSWPIAFSVLLHGLVAGALLLAAFVTIDRSPPSVMPLPIDAVVMDSQVLHAAQRALAERAEQEAARARAAADDKAAAAAAAAEQTAIEQQHAEEAAKAADTAKAQAAADAERVAA